ncbi:MAG: hypothetical protein IJ609_03140 [Paludibacteraceae bacterium]|nr:hypothetical protein [Paludibacteraceae bacterium]MBR1480906.1 hypothetical protein [Paludibacteraceae bacterium]
MPYRRLPNTDQARLRCLQKAVQHASEADFNEQVLNYRTQTEAQRLLMQFENQVSRYQDNFNTRVSTNKQYRRVVQNARMYISHFIQVLNLAVIRGEIKKDAKALYGLDPASGTLPDLSTEEAILQWGQNVIRGEQERIAHGGFPIYNPAINKVQVYYDIFKENQLNHSFHARTSSQVYDDLESLRKQADALILDIWNQVENYYRDLLPFTRMQHCKAYGVIYYYRPGEKKLSAETDRKLQDLIDSQPLIQWSESE